MPRIDRGAVVEPPSTLAMNAVDVHEAVIPDDLAIVRELFAEYAASLEVDLSFQGFVDELATLPGRYVAPAGGLWLARVAGRVAACVALRPLDAQVCEIKRLYVRPACRGAGIGRLLAETALARAMTSRCERVCLDTLPSMRGAIVLYRSLGFREIDAYYDNPVAGALFLELRLRPAPASR